MSVREKQLLSVFGEKPEPFYSIGIYGDVDKSPDLSHEIAHGLFYTNPEYRASVIEVLGQFDLSKLKTKLRGMAGYHEDVLDDECQAYCVGESSLIDLISTKMREAIRQIYKKYTRGIKT